MQYTNVMRKIIHHLMATGRGTRDLCGAEGLTTEQFVDAVSYPASRLCALPFDLPLSGFMPLHSNTFIFVPFLL